MDLLRRKHRVSIYLPFSKQGGLREVLRDLEGEAWKIVWIKNRNEMGELNSKDKYKGSIGELVFYEMNGKTYVRKKRTKMSKTAKKKSSWKGALRHNTRLAKAAGLARLLRKPIPPYSSYSHLHSRLSGKLIQIIGMDEVHHPDSSTLLPHHFHHISAVKTNDLIDSRILEALGKAELTWNPEGLEVLVKKLPLKHLPYKPDAIELWLKVLEMKPGKHPKIVNEKGDHVVFEPHESFVPTKFKIALKTSEADTIFAVLLGFRSLIGGNQVKDQGMNGFVFFGFGG